MQRVRLWREGSKGSEGSEGSGGRFLGLTGPMGRRVLKFDGAFGPEGCGGGFAADYKKAGPRPPVISTVAERSGEISLLNSPGSIEAGDLSTQSIMGAVPVCLP